MFCPNCRAEYRPGFTKCADCAVELVSELPPKPPSQPGDATEYPSVEFLVWFVPLACLAALLPPVLVLIVYLGVFGDFSWRILVDLSSDSLRSAIGRYVLLAFVPFGFLWYRLVRYPHRPKLIRVLRGGPPNEAA